MEKLIVGNLKNYMDINDVSIYLKESEKISSRNVIICPSNIYIPYFLKKNYKVGIQNILDSDETCTGEISASQAKKIGISCAIIGHSERRNKFNETDEVINNKIKSSLKEKLSVILCIGESLEQKDNAINILKNQIIECLKDINLDNIVIAYEPVWAIGTGLTPSIGEINNIVINIKSIVKQIFNKDIKVLYGGSVNGENIADIIKVVDGVLIGKASTDIEEFLKIIEVVNH